MSCFDKDKLQKFIDGELSYYEINKISNHLDKCENCMEIINEKLKIYELEDNFILKNELSDSINLNDRFNNLQNKINKKGDIKIMKNKKKFIAVVATIGILAIGVPVLGGDAITDFFRNNVLNDNIVNNGMVREDGTTVDTLENGNFIPLNKKIINNGITVHLTDLFVSKTKISLNYRIEDENGNLLPYEFNTEGLDIRDSGIENGKQLYPPTYYLDKEKDTFSILQYIQTSNENNLPFNLIKDEMILVGNGIGIREQQKEDTTEWTLNFVSFEPIPYPVIIDININKIGETEGEWKTQIEITENMLNIEK